MRSPLNKKRLVCLFKSWKALVYYAFGNSDRAAAELEYCIQIDPKNGPNLRTLGTILINKGNYLDGIRHLKDAIQYLPPSDRSVPEALAYAAYGYEKTGRINESLGFYEKALNSWVKDCDFKQVDLLYNMGTIYLEKKDPVKAIELFKKGLELDNKEARIHFGLGIAYHQLNDERTSLHYLNIAMELEPAYKNDDTMKRITEAIGGQVSIH
jgi:tetratricopeptide (TPR) repeat protein